MQVYHSTTKNVVENIKSNGFIPNNDENCNLYCGMGIYFYVTKYNAIDFGIKRSNIYDYERYKQKMAILTTDIADDIELIDLDDRETLNKFLVLYQVSKPIIGETNFKDKFVSGVDNQTKLSAFINFLKLYRFLDNKKGVRKTITEKSEKYEVFGIKRIPRLVINLFDNSEIDINYINELEITKNEFDSCKDLHEKKEV